MGTRDRSDGLHRNKIQVREVIDITIILKKKSKNMKKSLIAAFMLVIAGKTFAATADTLTVTTQPQMHCENCEKKIKSNIRFVKGTKKIETSVDDQKVTIVYDARKAKYDDFVEAFKKIGYEIKKK